MHIVTYYSFKGGVGRTMALANTAIMLAQKGRRVLVVDFDLEAPGLSSYDAFKCRATDAGMLEYVQHYISTNNSADVVNFIARCEFQGTPLWIMPAGASDQLYGARFNAVDWQDLYENRQGFLFFEDLKAQWARYEGHGFDYVLIDSRTGHTDVGGICTRQLPDAVVIMFAPNEQNIKGLESIVTEIRSEERAPLGRRIKLHFCPSNVPSLDDENGILSSILKDAESRLGYYDSASVIHHYNNLELLLHSPFVVAHPNSRISDEYEKLVSAILAGNTDDKEGSILAIERLLEVYSNYPKQMAAFAFYETNNTISDIREKHSSDPEVAFHLARIYSHLGRYEDEIKALSVAISGEFQLRESLRRRAVAELAVERRGDAVADITQLLHLCDAEAHELVPAIEILRAVSPDWISIIQASGALSRLEAPAQLHLVQSLQTERAGLQLAEKLVRDVIGSEHIRSDVRRSAINSLATVLIALGHFSGAKEVIALDEDSLIERGNISDVFNWAMADWGENGRPNIRMFAQASRLGKSYDLPDGNYNQCMALSAFVISDSSLASAYLEKARYSSRHISRVFSCWRYLYVTQEEMMHDLSAMQEQARGGALNPPFLETDTAH